MTAVPSLAAAVLPVALVAVLAAAGSAAAAPQTPAGETEAAPNIFVLTMGPDHSQLFREWGHAALCVDDRCFNYGTTDFSRPAGLTREVLMGEAYFWVAASDYEDTVQQYARMDRSIFRQDLDLDEAAREVLLGRVAADLVPGASEYLYNHFSDNCTTRIRDYLDEAGGGALRQVTELPPVFREPDGGYRLRTHMRRGLTTRPLLNWLSDIGVGRSADRPATAYEVMFLPGALRYGVEQAFGAAPQQLRQGRDGDLLPPDPGSSAYVPWLAAVSVLLSGAILQTRREGLSRAARAAAGAALGVVGAAGLLLFLLSPLPAFSTGLLFLGVPATDFLLATRFARAYSRPRAVFGVLFLIALGAGLTPQPLGWTVAAGTLLAAAVGWRLSPRRRPADPPAAVPAVAAAGAR